MSDKPQFYPIRALQDEQLKQSHQAPNYVQRSKISQKHDEIMPKNKFTGIATQPQRNRKLCQFNKDHYCTTSKMTPTYKYYAKR